MYKTDAILTEREAEVVLGYVREMNGKEIADKCCLAYRTVVCHTQNAFDKAGCARSIHALVSWWYQVNFPELVKKIGAAACVLLMLFSISTHEDRQRVRRAIRRTRYEQEYVINITV